MSKKTLKKEPRKEMSAPKPTPKNCTINNSMNNKVPEQTTEEDTPKEHLDADSSKKKTTELDQIRFAIVGIMPIATFSAVEGLCYLLNCNHQLVPYILAFVFAFALAFFFGKEAEKRKKSTKKRIDEINKELETALNSKKALDDKIEELKKQNFQAVQDAETKGSSERSDAILDDIKKNFEETKETMTIEEALKVIATALKQCKAQIAELTKSVETAKNQAVNKAEVDALQQKAKLDQDAQELQKKLKRESDEDVKKRKTELEREYTIKSKRIEDDHSKKLAELENTRSAILKEKEDAQKMINDAQEMVVEAQKKQEEAEAAIAGAQQLSDEAAQRVKDIEATDKGELQTLLEQVQASLAEQESLLAQCNEQKEAIERAKIEADQQIETLQSALDEEKQAHQATKDEYRTKVNNLKASHKSKLAEKDQEHRDAVNKMKEDHTSAVNKMKEDHTSVVNKMKEDHKSEIEGINTAHADELQKNEAAHSAEMEKMRLEAKTKEDSLKQTISEQKSSISTLEDKFKAETNQQREQSEHIAELLFSWLKNNNVMVACEDAYNDKVEEKLQDLLYGSKQMLKNIKELPEAETPSAWLEALTSYIMSQIEENTSLINRLLKYYAMSNVPFMLDAERENGIYFVRKNIKQAYDYVLTLLTQCGITPIIPSAFVENKDEGEYEVAGQFNDIESFCPGNMSEHIDHIERSGEGLSDIIIGITRVGYCIKNEKVIKAQVITQ